MLRTISSSSRSGAIPTLKANTGVNDQARTSCKLWPSSHCKEASMPEPKTEARGLVAATKRLADYCKHAICAVRCTARRLLR